MQGSAYSRKYYDCYFPADVTIVFDGEPYEFPEAGIRIKGNLSRQGFFDYGFQGNLPHLKISFKATFDSDEYLGDANLTPFHHDWSEDAAGRKARKKRNFLGLEKLDVKYIPRNGNWGDNCTLREIYAYDAFRSQGLDAPYANSVYAELHSDSGSIYGDYEAIEPIDKEFLKRRYDKNEAKGDLYKCVYNDMGPADFTRNGNVDRDDWSHVAYGGIGVEDNYSLYAPRYQLKTNDDGMQESDFSRMCSLMKSIWEVLYNGASEKTLTDAIDVDQFLRWSAVSYLLGNPDDQRYNSNNYYVYFRPSDGKATFIPYDWDWCLGLTYTDRDMAGVGPMEDWVSGARNRLYGAVLFENGQAGYDPSANRAKYFDYVCDYAQSVLNPQHFAEIASKASAQNPTELSRVSNYCQAKQYVII